MTRRIKNFFQRNTQQKIISLIIAVALWFFVMGSQDPVMEGSFNVPVSIINSARDYKAFYDDQQIKISLSAPRSNFADYGENDIRAYVNASSLTEGEYDLPVEANFPKGFELVKISPAQIHVKLDPYIERQIAAEVIVNGTTVSDAVVKSVAKSLDNLTIIGPKTTVGRVSRVIGYVGLTGNDEDFDMQVPMSAIDSDGREVTGVRVVPSVINVKVDLETGVQKKFVPITANLIAPGGWEISSVVVDPEQTEIAGKEEILNTITTLQTTPLSLPAVQETFRGTLRVLIPDGITSQVDKVEITATFKKIN